MKTTGLTNDPSERGVRFQAVGFAVVGCASVAILQIWSESSSWLYHGFETAVSRLYWAFVVPLAALFDGGRRMFETRKAIREAAIERAIARAIEKAIAKDRKRILASWEEYKDLPRKELKQKIFQVEQS